MRAPSDSNVVDFLTLIDDYDAIFFDAYGVLVTHGAAVAGAREVLDTLRARRRPFFVLTNDASRSPADCAGFYRRFGLHVDDDQVVSAGLVMKNRLSTLPPATRVVVLGTDHVRRYLEGDNQTFVNASEPFDVVALCDEAFSPFLSQIDDVVSGIVRAHAEGRSVLLLLANPDVLYPKPNGSVGVTAGGVARLIESAVQHHLGVDPRFSFVPLGKPSAAIFDAGIARAGTRNVLMVGDQFATDILGAQNVGIDSAHYPSAVSTTMTPSYVPTHRLRAFAETSQN